MKVSDSNSDGSNEKNDKSNKKVSKGKNKPVVATQAKTGPRVADKNLQSAQDYSKLLVDTLSNTRSKNMKNNRI